MSHKKLNQTGFTMVEGLLIIIALALVTFVGYYVYHSQKQASNTYNSAAKIATNEPTSVKKSSGSKYLDIKEWGVKMPLSTANVGAYYTTPTTDQLGQDISFFDAGIDKLSNANGVNCQDNSYPLFVITRIKTSDVATSTDGNSPNFIVETNASMFHEFNFDKTYSYAGRSIHQSAPKCDDLNPAGDYKADPKVDAVYKNVQQAFDSSFAKLQAD